MTYFDGFILAVPAANKDKYRDHANSASGFIRQHGATRMVENWGDDVPHGKVTDFYRATKLEDGEIPLFSWMEYPDRQTRDALGAAVTADEQMMAMSKTMPFDAGRMVYGGFESVSDTGPNGTPGYVDGMISPVPLANRQAYEDLARRMAPMLLENGALRVVDTWGDDIPAGQTTDFQRAVNSTDDETVSFSFVEWPSKEARDQGWNKLMQDPRMAPTPEIFDATRSIMGGFVPLLVV